MKRSDLRDQYPKAFEKLDQIFANLQTKQLTEEEEKEKYSKAAEIATVLSIIRLTSEGLATIVVGAAYNYRICKKFRKIWCVLRLPIIRNCYCFILSHYSLKKAQNQCKFVFLKEDRKLFKQTTCESVISLISDKCNNQDQLSKTL